MRVLAAVFVLWLAWLPAAEGADLYRASAIVTGQDNLEERARGIREALDGVMARVSADIGILDAEGYAGIRRDAEALVDGFTYVDRKAGIQISDEQGTRDRSFVLEVRFRPSAIDQAIAMLGRTPWTGERPTLLVHLEVTDGRETFLVTRTSERGWGQRDVIDGMSLRSGVPLILPEVASSDPDADGLLSGEMAVTADGYWTTAWRLEVGNVDETWRSPVTTFDRAIADGVWRSASILARQ